MGKYGLLILVAALYICTMYLVSRHLEFPGLTSSGGRVTNVVPHNQTAALTTNGTGDDTLPIAPTPLTADPDELRQDTRIYDEKEESPSHGLPDKSARIVKAASLIPSILDPTDTPVDRMACPPINNTRYGYLRPTAASTHPEEPRQYFFALNLRQCVDLLPRLLGSLVEAIRFLGPAHCALSIVEGNSDDGTLEVLRLLIGELEAIGVEYWLASSTLDPSKGLRIRKLAKLRAMALEPVTGPVEMLEGLRTEGKDEIGTTTYFARPPVPKVLLAPDATIAFINDVAACAEDILELVHQRTFQSADMVCAMDWNNPFAAPLSNFTIPPIFYDVWVARSLTGNLFFDIPASTGTWENSLNLFFDHPPSQARFYAGLPTQVFSCWNGAVAMAAAPFVNGEVGFRWSRPGECYQGEPQLLCKNLWWTGHGKIAVVPAVNLEYTDASGRWIKKERGFVSDFVAKAVDARLERIIWEEKPPDMVKCVPKFTAQWWLPWNESMA